MIPRFLAFGDYQEAASPNSFSSLTDYEVMHFQELLCGVLGEKGGRNFSLNCQLLDYAPILRESLCEDVRPIAGHRGFRFFKPSPNRLLSE